jgi:hypothetical protein
LLGSQPRCPGGLRRLLRLQDLPLERVQPALHAAALAENRKEPKNDRDHPEEIVHYSVTWGVPGVAGGGAAPSPTL